MIEKIELTINNRKYKYDKGEIIEEILMERETNTKYPVLIARININVEKLDCSEKLPAPFTLKNSKIIEAVSNPSTPPEAPTVRELPIYTDNAPPIIPLPININNNPCHPATVSTGGPKYFKANKFIIKCKIPI